MDNGYKKRPPPTLSLLSLEIETHPQQLSLFPSNQPTQNPFLIAMKLMHPTSLFAFAMLAIFALAFAPMANAQGRPCTADIMCKTGQFCLNNQCTLRTCSWRDDDMACSKFNATTWCQKEGGQCVPRTALANAACEPQSRDNSCSEGLVCDPANSKCVDAAQFVQSFWEKNKTYIIIGIVVVLALGCCAIACFCCVVKKGVGFAGRLMKK